MKRCDPYPESISLFCSTLVYVKESAQPLFRWTSSIHIKFMVRESQPGGSQHPESSSGADGVLPEIHWPHPIFLHLRAHWQSIMNRLLQLPRCFCRPYTLSELRQTKCVVQGTSNPCNVRNLSGVNPPISTGCARSVSPTLVIAPFRANQSSSAGAGHLAPDDFFAQCFLSTHIVPSTTVFTLFRSKLKGKDIDVTNVGRFAVILA